MKTLAYTPKKETGFTGTVMLEMMNYQERLKKMQEMNLDDEKDAIKSAEAITALVSQSVKRIDVKHGDTKFTDLEELGYFDEGTKLINELSVVLIKGIPLGNG